MTFQPRKHVGWSLPLTAALLLTACGGGGAPDPQPQPQPTEQAGLIRGQVQPMKDSTQTVFPVNTAVQTPGVPFTASVRPDGTFDLNLPDSATLGGTYVSDLKTVRSSYSYCDQTLFPDATFTTNAPDDLKMLQLNELRSNDGRQLVAFSGGGTTVREWWYLDRDINLTLSGRNCFFIGDVSASLPLKKGWNVVEQASVGLGTDKVSTTYTVVQQPATPTVFTDGSVGAQSLRGFSLNLLRPWQTPADLK